MAFFSIVRWFFPGICKVAGKIHPPAEFNRIIIVSAHGSAPGGDKTVSCQSKSNYSINLNQRRRPGKS